MVEQMVSLEWVVPAASGFMALSAAMSFFIIRRVLSTEHRVSQRLAGKAAAADAAMSAKTAGEWVKEIGGRIAEQNPVDMSLIRKRLRAAGYRSHTAPFWYFGLRVVGLALALIALMALWPFVAAYAPGWALSAAAILVAAVAIVGPSFYLDHRIKARMRDCQDGFPDMMDLMVASIEAGLSLDAAVGCVADEIGGRYPVLRENLKSVILELRAGRSRQEAMAHFADRAGFAEAQSLSTMLRQSEEMGASLGTTLRAFSDDMRTRRMLIAEEKAMALPAKLTVPLILFIFPTIMGVVMLPAAIRMMQSF